MSIYKKQSEEQKTFETAQDFLKYYEKNKEDLDEMNTRSMNWNASSSSIKICMIS